MIKLLLQTSEALEFNVFGVLTQFESCFSLPSAIEMRLFGANFKHCTVVEIYFFGIAGTRIQDLLASTFKSYEVVLVWNGLDWYELVSIGMDWYGSVWIGMELEWIGMDRYGLVWNGLDWYGLVWIGMELEWIGLDWFGLVWIGMDWYGSVWIGMDWYGLEWIGMD